MLCRACGHENPAGARFCNGCGARLEAACAKCGQVNPPGSRFCNGCGQPLESTTPAAPPHLAPSSTSRFASPDTYTPRHLAEKILTSRASLEGERKQVTVLFADLKGSMELLADRDPEEARALLDPVLERMMEAVHRYEGTVNQVMGDGIMALFGVPLAHEDHAVRACYAALSMQEAVRRLAEEVRRTRGATVRIRIGLNSGEVVVRAIGGDLRTDYTAVGQTTHLAARMEQLADPGTTLLSPGTVALAEGYVEVRPLGPVPVKGLAEPVEVYELTGAGVARSRLRASALRGLTRFVGRSREIEQLDAARERAGRGQGQLVAVVGEPGVGKSRLYWEFTHAHRPRGWAVVESGSVSYGKATPYLPVIDVVRAYFQVDARDDARKIREKVMGKVLSLDRALEPSISALLALLDVPTGDDEWERLDGPQRRRRTQEGVKRLLLRECQVQPLVVIFEDLHWVDGETQALLDSVVESLPTARLLLLVNYRPEYIHPWTGKTYYHQLRIDPLPPESAEELLEPLLGTDPGLGPLKRVLIKRTEGNPLFLEESVRTLVETGVLVGERGAHRLARDAAQIQVPATVQAILAARIDRLAAEDKRLLEAASVIGKDVSFALLAAVADLADDDLRAGLARLQTAEFLYETQLFPDLQYTFKHALTHEVAYASLLHDRRRRLHARVVEALEALPVDRQAEQVDRLADHAVRGELWVKAAMYLRQAGLKAAARWAYREAAAHLEQSVEALAKLPETRERQEQSIDIRSELYAALNPQCELARIAAQMEAAEATARAIGDKGRLARVFGYQASYLWMAGRYAESRARGEMAERLARELGDVRLLGFAQFYLAQTSYAFGEYAAACARLHEAIRARGPALLRERAGARYAANTYRGYLAWYSAERGDFSEALTHSRDSLALAAELEHPYTTMLVSWSVGIVYTLKGDIVEAVHLLERSLSLCRERNFAIGIPVGAAALGHAYVLAGQVDDGLALLEEARERHAAQGLGAMESRCLTQLAVARLRAGHVAIAQERIDQALDLVLQRGERGQEAYARLVLGDITAERGDATSAHEHYRLALERATQLDLRPLVAHCHLALGRLFQRSGKHVEAQEHLSAASAMTTAMDMTVP
jgi:class 3 adenylate cyclase/tetratricopeptide (TPR) repeat protein